MMDGQIHELHQLVLNKIEQLGEAEAKVYFDVSGGTISAWRNKKTTPSLAAAAKCYDDSLRHNAPEANAITTEPVTILLPQYENVEPTFMFTLIKAMKGYGMEKIGVIPKDRTLIIEARNWLAEMALLTKSEWFIFFDSDMVLPCGSAPMLRKQGMNYPEVKMNRNIITRLMSHPKDKLVVGCLYKDRRGINKAQCELAFRSESENTRLLGMFDPKRPNAEADGLEETGWVAFGGVRIHRSIFERMKEAAKPGGILEEIAPPKGREGEPYGYFDTTRVARGEDVKFCRRVQQLGEKVWVDTGATIGHMGKRLN